MAAACYSDLENTWRKGFHLLMIISISFEIGLTFIGKTHSQEKINKKWEVQVWIVLKFHIFSLLCEMSRGKPKKLSIVNINVLINECRSHVAFTFQYFSQNKLG